MSLNHHEIDDLLRFAKTPEPLWRTSAERIPKLIRLGLVEEMVIGNKAHWVVTEEGKKLARSYYRGRGWSEDAINKVVK